MKRWTTLVLAGLAACSPKPIVPPLKDGEAMKEKPQESRVTEDDWKKRLNPEQYSVCRLKGTEAPNSGKYYMFFGKGTYKCVCCGAELFSSETKYKSLCGWPSFWAPIREDAMAYDTKGPEDGAEVMCKACGSHLGHVFHDGPPPTGLRY